MRGVPWFIRIVTGLLAAALVAFVAGAQPAPEPRTAEDAAAADPADDPIGALLERVAGERPQTAPPVVIGLRLGEDGERSRFVIEISDPVEAHPFTLTDPSRVVIDLPEVMWRVPDNARPTGRGLINSYRYGLFRAGNSRFVIDLNGPVRVEEPRLLPPEGGFSFRLVIDLYPATMEEFAANAGWPADLRSLAEAAPQPGAETEAEIAATPRFAAGTQIVVVDPGHGGIDPGTHGGTGLQEKAVVLAVAKELRAALEATGRYKVYLTRDRDIFIPLRGRVDIARAADADLFVSLHADSNPSSDIRGASVYTLSEDASDREAAALAEKENRSDVIAGVDLSGDNSPVASILIDLAQRDTLNRSVRFAETVLTTLPRATMVRPTTPHRSAGFAVLKAPDVPAALIELGYLTNTRDEREMATAAWRTEVAQAISAAIDRHFAENGTFSIRRAAAP